MYILRRNLRTFGENEFAGVSKRDVDMKYLNVAIATLGFAALASAQVTVNKAEGWLESAYAEWVPVSGAKSYNVYCDGVKIDDPLVRSYGSYMRADVLGLKAGSHTLKIAPVVNGSEGASVTKTVTVKAHDRAGFAFSNGRVPGAYNTDGTLKSGTAVLYVSENTKNTVTMDVATSSKGTKTACTGIQGILTCYKKGYETTPLNFRLIGDVTDPSVLESGDLMIDLGNSETSYVTIEGVGNDATVNGWGIRLKNAQNVEIRNLGIMNVNSGEGDNIGLQQNDKYIWVHNNDFFYGDAGSDADQVKGDGALDCKKSTYVTFSYNHFWDNGKSNLLGLSEGTTEGYYITYHHNWYDHSDSRHPRIRYYSAHVYNNYYDGNAKYGIGSTLGSSVFAEGNYFRNCKYPILTSMQGSDVYAGGTVRDTKENPTFSSEAGGSIKAYNNHMEGSYTFIPYGSSTYTLKGVESSLGGIDSKADFDAYVVTSRTQEMPASVKSYDGSNTHNNFDLNSSVMYKYTADEPAAAKTNVMTYAGRVQGGDFKWTFDNSVDDASYAVNQPLKDALVAYKGTVQSIQGEGNLPVYVEPSSSSSAVSSSSVENSSSSVTSSSSVSSSSVTSSSSVANPESSATVAGDTQPIDKDVVHNFTNDGTTSGYFKITGTLSSDKGSVTYDGTELSKCLKMESSTTVSFTLAKAATVTLVFNSDFVKTVKVDGDKVTASAGVVTVELAAGSHTITKGDVSNLYLIKVSLSGSDEGTTSIAAKALAVAPMRYSAQDCRLEIFAEDVRRLDIASVNGQVVMHRVGVQSVVDLNGLKQGIYLVRLVTGNRTYLQKVVKR